MATHATAAFDVLMPRLSDSMTEGAIVRWLCEDGDLVRTGDEIVEVETDKATMPFEAEVDGPIRILVAEGEVIEVGRRIAVIGEPGSGLASTRDRKPASPLARRLAAKNGLDLAEISGSGAAGRIVKADIERVLETGERGAASHQPLSAEPEVAETERPLSEVVKSGRIPLSATQSVIARRMSEAHAMVPAFYTENRVDAEPLHALRSQLRDEGVELLPSLNDFVVKAVALTLQRHSVLNLRFIEDELEDPGRIDIGVAIAGERSLYVPVVRRADLMPIVEIAARIKRVSAQARSGGLRPEDLADPTFTVSNLGMYGVTRFQAIVSPPQTAILAVGAALPQVLPDGENGHRIAPAINLGLSADHRVAYGSDAAAFLAALRERLTMPTSLLL